MDKKKIAVIVRSLKYGGMERAACNMVDAFAEAGHDTHLIYFRNKNKAISPRNSRVNVHHFDLNLISNLTVIGLFFSLIARLFNMIFNRSYAFIMGWFLHKIYVARLFLLERKIGKFDLILIRGQGTFELIWPAKDKRTIRICVNVPSVNIKPKAYSKALYHKARVATISHRNLAEYTNFFELVGAEPTDLMVIRNIFPMEIIEELANHNDTELPNNNFIVSVGRLTSIKNNQLLINAYNYLIKTKNIKQDLYIVGDGDDANNLKVLVEKLNLINRVHFIGYKSNPYPWLKKSDIFVLSSKIEGLGGVILEAIGCQTRLVVTNSQGGVHDIMDMGLQNFVCEFDEKDMADKIWFSLNKEPDLQLYKKILKDYDPHEVVNQWLSKIK